MNNDNKTTRELAIEWWEGLTHSLERDNLNKKYFPSSSLASITCPNIEHIYLSEHPETAEINMNDLEDDIYGRHPKPVVDEDKEIDKLEQQLWNEPTGAPTSTLVVDVLEDKNVDLLEGITPGEWIINKHSNTTVETISGRTIANSSSYSTNTDNGNHVKENESNARLISLAPQLAKENKELKEKVISLIDLIKADAECFSALASNLQKLKKANELLINALDKSSILLKEINPAIISIDNPKQMAIYTAYHNAKSAIEEVNKL